MIEYFRGWLWQLPPVPPPVHLAWSCERWSIDVHALHGIVDTQRTASSAEPINISDFPR